MDGVLWLLVGLWLVVVPIRATVTAPRRRIELAQADAAVRRRETVRTIVIQWVATLVMGAAWVGSGRSLEALRLPGEPTTVLQWAVVAGSLGLLAWAGRGWLQLAGSPEGLAEVRRQVEPALLGLMPRTPIEHRRFVALSITAGICEEFIYRGVALNLFAEVNGMGLAVLVTTLAFGSSHAYQGGAGVFRTAMVGLLFAGMVLGSGSLLLAMFVHALVDILQGRLLSAAAVRDER